MMSGEKIDAASAIIFPLLFTLFNVIYWSYYLLASVEQRNFLVSDRKLLSTELEELAAERAESGGGTR